MGRIIAALVAGFFITALAFFAPSALKFIIIGLIISFFLHSVFLDDKKEAEEEEQIGLQNFDGKA